MPGLIDTVYIRIRPLIAGFAEETTAGIRGALTDVDAQIAASSKAQLAGSAREVEANKAVADSYLKVADAATVQADVAKKAADEMAATIATVAKTNVAASVQQLDANAALAQSYLAIATTADTGSTEQIAAIRAATAAASESSLSFKDRAEIIVASTEQEITAQRELAIAIKEVADAAEAGSAKEIAAQKAYRDASLGTSAETAAAGDVAGASFVGGMKKHFLNAGTILGVGFGAAVGVDLIKHVVADAGQVQKSAEVIRSAFGPASKQVFVGFRDSVAANLGISAQLADATSARFGIFFHNVGIAGPEAAKMTVGFEKLAGSLSMVRGVDPSTTLQNIVLAAEGNTRGLKQLGIALSTTQEEAYAALHGISASATTALTPAQKAEAIFGLATQKLGYDMQQAQKHSGDLTSVTFKLKAELSNAEDALGKALLPTVKKYVTELADWLQKMEKSGRLQRDFNDVVHTTAGIVKDVVAAVKFGVGIWEDFSGAVGGAKHAFELLLAVMAVNKIRQVASAIQSNLLNAGIKQIGPAAVKGSAEYDASMTSMDIATVGLAATIKSALISTGIGALVVAVGIAAVEIIDHWNTVKRWIEDFAHWISSHAYVLFAVPILGPFLFITVEIIKHWGEIKKVVSALADFMTTVFVHPIRAIQQLWDHLKGDIIGLLHDIERDALEIFLKVVEPFTHLPSFLGGWARSLKTQAQDALAALDPTKVLSHFAAKAQELGALDQGLGPVKAAAKKAGTDSGTAFNTAMANQLGGPGGVASTLTAPLKPVLDQLQNAITAARTKIQSTVMDAKNNFVKIGDDLAKTIEQIQAKIGGTAGAIAGSPQGQAFAKLKKLIEEGAPSFEIQRAQLALGDQLKNVGKTQQPLIKTQLDNLTAALNKGQISYRQFEERLHQILHDDGVTLSQALKAGGPAFADAFRAEVRALGEQAKQIEAIPAKFRGIGGAGGAADLKIIKPLEVIRQENEKISVAAIHQRDEQIRYAHEMVKYQADILKAQQKQNALVNQFMAAGATRAQAEAAARHELGAIPSARGGAAAAGAATHDAAGAAALTKIPGQLQQSRADQQHIAAGASTERQSAYGELVKIVAGLSEICHDIMAAEAAITKPLDVLHNDNIRIASEAARQRDAQLRATDRTNRELRQLRRGTGKVPGFNREPHGKASHDARLASRIHS